jgi:hypothetical protein
LEKIENLRLDGDKLRPPPQLLPVYVEREILELVNQLRRLPPRGTLLSG